MPPSRTDGTSASKSKTGSRSHAQEVPCPVKGCGRTLKANGLAQHVKSHRRKANQDSEIDLEDLLGGPQALAPTALEREYGIAGPSRRGRSKQKATIHDPFAVSQGHLSQPSNTVGGEEDPDWVTGVQDAQGNSEETIGDSQVPDDPELADAWHDLGGRLPAEDDFKVESHPRTQKAPRYFTYDAYTTSLPRVDPLAFQSRYKDRKPWAPYVKRLDFEISEWMRHTGLNRQQIDGLLSIIHQVRKMPKEVTLVDSQHVLEMWDITAEHCNIGLKPSIVKAEYQEEMKEFTVWGSDLWESWAMKLLKDPVHIHAMQWDALRTFRHDGAHWERFINEPWTADAWWEVQSEIPSGAHPFCILVYADATKLSTMGTAKGHPVYARCLNLPCELRNGEESAGGRLIGFMPSVSEDADKAGKKPFVDFKRVVWHETFKIFLKKMMQYEKTGTKVQCGDGVWRLILPVILILCADYEEQCIMAAIRGGPKSKYPCPHCLVPLKDMWKVVSVASEARTVEAMKATYEKALTESSADSEETLKAVGLRKVFNVFWNFLYTRVYAAISWDRLHAYHGGLFSDHLFEEILKILEQKNKNKRLYRKQVEDQLSQFPSWRDLNHFSEIAKLREFSDGRKYEDLSKLIVFASHNVLPEAAPDGHGAQLLRLVRSYLELDMYASLRNHTETTLRQGREELKRWEKELKIYLDKYAGDKKWTFPKVHTHGHLFDEIERKGATRNTSTKPNERKHHSVKKNYGETNFKNVEYQLSKREAWDLAMILLRDEIDRYDEMVAATSPEEDEDPATEQNGFEDAKHLTAGSPVKGLPLKVLREHFPARFGDALNPTRLRSQILSHLNTVEGFDPATITVDTEVTLYRYIKVNYVSKEDSTLATDFLRMNRNFHSKERYDSCLLNVDDTRVVFGQMVAVLGVMVSNKEHLLAVVLPYDEKLSEQGDLALQRLRKQRDKDLRFHRLRARNMKKSTVVFAASILRGALLVSDYSCPHGDEYLVVDVVDQDMWLRMKTMKPHIMMRRADMNQPRVGRAHSESCSSEESSSDEVSGDDAAVSQHQLMLDRCRAASRSTDFSLMKKALDDAQMTIDDYFTQLNKSKRQRSKRTTDEDNVIDEVIPPQVNSLAIAIVEQAKKSAQIYVLCWCYFTSDSLMGHPKPRTAWDDVEVRFATDKSKSQGYVAELFECVPTGYHEYLTRKRKPFPQLFLKYAGTARSNHVSRVRSASAQIFAGLRGLFERAREELEGAGRWPINQEERKFHVFHQDLFETEFNRGLVPVFLDLLGFDAPKKEFKRWCKILYDEFRDDVPSGLFKNAALIRLALVMIYGPKAVNGNPAACKIRKGNVFEGVTDPTTSAGLISLCAILARFLLTADKEFPQQYKRYLMTSWNDQTTKDLVAFWNRQVFPTSLASVDPEFRVENMSLGQGRGQEDDDDIAAMRRAAEQERLAKEQEARQAYSSSGSSSTLVPWQAHAGPSRVGDLEDDPGTLDEADDQEGTPAWGTEENGHQSVIFEKNGEDEDDSDEDGLPPGASILPAYLTTPLLSATPAISTINECLLTTRTTVLPMLDGTNYLEWAMRAEAVPPNANV
ncbi:hypothetical protein BKA70DRAFT_1570479 [Coprinopsis sp. MPI-PUGE-AT-0042]|nr:hypothetical protein BKA70DRAFT_1570479 [Coprinopsis sp. MPI-PUGE-AT-0042]